MTLSQWFVIVVLAVPLGFAFLDRLKIDVAALCIAALIGIGQIAGLQLLGDSSDSAALAFGGFSKPAVLTLIGLFILTGALDKHGVTRWMARRLIALGGNDETRLIVLFAMAGALLSLFMNNLAAGALLLPSALETARRTHISPSRLLMPLSFGTMLGGTATYFTTANIIMSGLLPLANPPQESLHVLDFTPTGALITLGGIAFLALAAPRLLPDRGPAYALSATPEAAHPRAAFWTLLIGGAALVASIFGAPTYLAVMAGAVCLLIGGLLSSEEAYRAVEWRAIFLVAAMYAASAALVYTGLASMAGEIVVNAVRPLGGIGLAAGVYLLTGLLAQIMGGQVAALVTGPIALSAALQLGISPQAIAVAVATSCSAVFLTPVSHAVNVLVMTPGGYRPADFFQLGAGLTLVSFVMMLIGLRLFWGVA